MSIYIIIVLLLLHVVEYCVIGISLYYTPKKKPLLSYPFSSLFDKFQF